jgi:hypothetical protein
MNPKITNTAAHPTRLGVPFTSALAAGLLAVLSTGCTQTPLCEELGECGGPVPYGVWFIDANHISCSEDLYVPPTDPRLLGGEVPAARVQTIEPALFDWCYLLVADSGDPSLWRTPRFYYESGAVGAATVSYNMDGTYTAGLTRTGRFELQFPPACMRAFGATDGKPASAMDPTPVGICKQLEVPVAMAGMGEGSYQNITCDVTPSEPQGCTCAFDVTETGGPSGHFQMLDSKTILHYSGSNFPANVTYCNKGNELELTGADGSYLFNAKGLRTLSLTLGAPPP